MSSIEKVLESLKRTTICSLRFIYDSYFLIEKILWFSLAVVGTLMIFVQLEKQINSWSDNPVIASQFKLTLDQIEFPAVTICHIGNSPFNVADRIYNQVEENSPKSRQIRNLLLKQAVSKHRIKQ